MRKIFLASMVWLIFFSCIQEKEYIIPSEYIQRDSMVTILADIHIAEARILSLNTGAGDKQKNASYYKYVFQKHAITPKQFKESLSYYSQSPELMNAVYTDVINELSRRQAEAEK